MSLPPGTRKTDRTPGRFTPDGKNRANFHRCRYLGEYVPFSTQRRLIPPAIALVNGGIVVGRLAGCPLLRSGPAPPRLGGLGIGVTLVVVHMIGSHGARPAT